jgi:serine/threonine-protein kinase RsbT
MSSDLHIMAPSVVSIRSDWDIIAARMVARTVARTMGFNTIDQARIATATSELTRNIILYAGDGTVTIGQVQRGDCVGIELMFEDHGPGILDMGYVWHDTTASNGDSHGMGLSASRRLMDEFYIESNAEAGTCIICRKWVR